MNRTAQQRVAGYAAHGASIRAAVEPLVNCFAIELYDDGSSVRAPSGGATFALEDELGNSATAEQVPRVQREQLPSSAVPAVLRLSYYDPARDYQVGEARASASDQPGNEEQQELPAVIGAAAAKAVAQQLLARSWSCRDRLTLRLPPRYLGIEPGAEIELPLSPRRWTLDKCTVDGLVAVAELRPSSPSITMPIARDQLSAAGAGLATVEVRQIGDWTASHPAELSLVLS